MGIEEGIEHIAFAEHQSNDFVDNEGGHSDAAAAAAEVNCADSVIVDDKNDEFYVVDLADQHRIVVKKSWVETPSSKESRIFFSPNLNVNAAFTNPKYYFKENKVDCYIGQVARIYGEFFSKRKITNTVIPFASIYSIFN